MSFAERVIDEARNSGTRLVYPEGTDERVIEAADRVKDQNIVDDLIVLHPEPSSVESTAAVWNPSERPEFDEVCSLYRERTDETDDDVIREKASDPLLFGAALVALGEVEGMVAGADNPTASVLRSAITMIGTQDGIDLVSSSFIMELEDARFGEEGMLVFTDPAVMPDPNADELAQIAEGALGTYENLLDGNDPRLAFLSFSTRGSADHPTVDEVRQAFRNFQNRHPEIRADGELQADAALVPEVAGKKCPDSSLEGKANILVFPDLNAANISYKLVERLGGANAYGPFLQGLDAPVNDLSRGCSVDDIVTVSAVTIKQARIN